MPPDPSAPSSGIPVSMDPGTGQGPIVFLHIPKTAGQTIHHELTRIVGAANVSPIRVHTQAKGGVAQMPPGYRLYSGHLDWSEIDTLPGNRFVFTVLRDPRERIASFYFYLLGQARTLSPEELQAPHRTGMRMILNHSADEYFFGGNGAWQTFVLDHYDNFYCAYFATGRMRGRREILKLSDAALIDQAVAQSERLDRIYTTTNLTALETDVAARTGQSIAVTGRYVNAGPQDTGMARWPMLLERLETDAGRARLETFAEKDAALMQRLGLPV